MWQTIATIATPLLIALGGFLGSGGTRLSKKISHHAELLKKLDDAPMAADTMRSLLSKEALWLSEREDRRNERKVNWSNVSGGIFFAIVTVASIYWLWQWSLYAQSEKSWLFPVAVAMLCFVGGLLCLVTGALFAQTFEPAKTEEKKAEEAELKAKKKAERDARTASRKAARSS